MNFLNIFLLKIWCTFCGSTLPQGNVIRANLNLHYKIILPHKFELFWANTFWEDYFKDIFHVFLCITWPPNRCPTYPWGPTIEKNCIYTTWGYFHINLSLSAFFEMKIFENYHFFYINSTLSPFNEIVPFFFTKPELTLLSDALYQV